MANAKSARGIWIPPPSSIYQLRIALRYIRPAIWRRVLVPELHEVKVEKILPFDLGAELPVCLDGERACPPEDCGSFPGYGNVLRVLAKARTAEDRQFREWVGAYDPEHFDRAAVNRRLQPRKQAKAQRTC